MTLNLLLSRRRHAGNPVILADPTGESIEPAVAALSSELGKIQHVVFPLPDDTTRRHLAPASVTRSRHADLWHALSTDERSRVLLAAGPTAAFLAPVMGPVAITVVAVCDPRKASVEGCWRAVLGPFSELDDPPDEAGSEKERERWLSRVRAATSRLELVRGADIAPLTRTVAAELGLGPKAAARAATAAASAGTAGDGSRKRDKPAHWLDEMIYSLTSAPNEEPPARSRRRRSTGTSRPRGGGTPRKTQRSRKRRRG